MLDHRIPRDAEHLQGLYAKAFDRICNQVGQTAGARLHD